MTRGGLDGVVCEEGGGLFARCGGRSRSALALLDFCKSMSPYQTAVRSMSRW